MMRAAVLLLALAAPVAAQAPAEKPSLGWFQGEWKGTATIFGRSATVSMSVAPALLGRATALTYRAEIPASGAQPEFRFEGRGTYIVAADGKVSGQWNDSQGNFHPLAGRVTGRSLAVTWGEPRTEVGHSSYVLGDDGKLTVTDAEMGRGALRVFATGTYTRQP